MDENYNKKSEEIRVLQKEIVRLREELQVKEEKLKTLVNITTENSLITTLSNRDIAMYSRQLILPQIGVSGQLKLKNTSFLIVGMGGLGCPAAQYLVAAGCGHIGLVDYDSVDSSNLHRQTLHTEARIGRTKVDSARIALLEMNNECIIIAYNIFLNSGTATELITKYDVILDCTDNVASRYLLNDVCILVNRPLVSASALQLDGQLSVYNNGENCPCYRCLFPVPPPAEAITSCGDGGVLGPVTGVMGSLQALEAIKVAIGSKSTLAGQLLIFDGMHGMFRNIKMRGKRPNCDICSTTPSITQLIDYERFCGMRANDKDQMLTIFPDSERISTCEFQRLQNGRHLLIDVRKTAEFEICKLKGSTNVPLKLILDNTYEETLKDQLNDTTLPIILLCRRGNDSQLAMKHMRNKYPNNHIRDIIGGLHAWHFNVDKNFPIY